MKDMLFSYDKSQQCFDLEVVNGEIQVGYDLRSLIGMSIFTDKRCEDYELQKPETDLRGFWGDAIDGIQTGSKLWTILRGKKTPDLLQKCNNYCNDALKWMISDGLVKAVTVDSSYTTNRLNITIKVQTNDNSFLEYKDSIWLG